jgi:Ulp1 family protease
MWNFTEYNHQPDFTNFRKFISIIKSGAHWYLVDIRANDEKPALHIYDSLSSSTKKYAQDMVLLTLWLNEARSRSRLPKTRWGIKKIPCTKQKNTWDCGVFAVHHAKALSIGQDSTITYLTGLECRYKIAFELLANKISDFM